MRVSELKVNREPIRLTDPAELGIRRIHAMVVPQFVQQGRTQIIGCLPGFFGRS